MQLQGIETALQKGCRLHSFLSGGGLRVIRLETKGGDLKGYGEHPHVDDALVHANEDYLAGGREYHEVYGENAKYPHYLTGSTSTASELDAWVRQGRTFDAWWENDQFVLELHGIQDVHAPKELHERVLATGNKEIWENRGFRYEITRSKFPNNEPCTSMRCLNAKKGIGYLMYDFIKTGRGKTFAEALTTAFAAEQVEVTKNN
jgi:hypothetical protein